MAKLPTRAACVANLLEDVGDAPGESRCAVPASSTWTELCSNQHDCTELRWQKPLGSSYCGLAAKDFRGLQRDASSQHERLWRAMCALAAKWL
eukprot:6212042-Pleurochrysis_carterae.AAC.1